MLFFSSLWAGHPTSKLGMLLLWSLAISMPMYSNFQINRAKGGTLKPLESRSLF